jgi:biotin operon repressor
MIPQDPVILLSFVNTQLRDNYSSLDALYEGLDIGDEQKEDLITKLRAIGYEYDKGLNQFR